MQEKKWNQCFLLAGLIGCAASFFGYQAIPASYACAAENHTSAVSEGKDKVLGNRQEYSFAEYIKRVKAGRDSKHLDQALEDANHLVSLRPQDPRGYLLRAATYVQMQKYQESLEDCNKTLQLAPKVAEAYVMRGAVYSAQGDFPRALADYQQAVALKPNNVKVHNDLAGVYGHLKQ